RPSRRRAGEDVGDVLLGDFARPGGEDLLALPIGMFFHQIAADAELPDDFGDRLGRLAGGETRTDFLHGVHGWILDCEKGPGAGENPRPESLASDRKDRETDAASMGPRPRRDAEKRTKRILTGCWPTSIRSLGGDKRERDGAEF